MHCCGEVKQLVHDDLEGINVKKEEAGAGADDDAFPSLKKLCLSELRSLRMFIDGLLTFPSLEILQVI
ncbi:hypothetical protein KSP39_PZI011985 [Platanthera zijinensis]|uniref:Uncharacterized protein n=1 Tax=Platanthera zijinensis TaxID=2320716 RepID=A0AAP0BI84_9ASPA